MTELEPARPGRQRRQDDGWEVVGRQGQRALDPGPRPRRDVDAAAGPSGLAELLDALRWRWPLALLVAAAITAGATVYVETLPSQYDAHALVAFAPRPDVSASSDTVRVLVPKYPSYVVAPATIARVASRAGFSASTARHAIDATVKTDTGTMTITARMKNPTDAAVLANAFGVDVVTFSQRDRLLEGQLVAPAIPPDGAAAPHRRLLEVAALLVGLLAGIGLSVLLERGRPRLRTWRDMAATTGYPVVGRIPPARILRNRLIQAFSDPEVGSAVRTLRANLEPQVGGTDVGTIVVTSSAKADGKTVVSTLLAEALARRGMRVLLVDADLHRSRLSKILASTNGGLSSVLRGEARLEDVAERGWIKGLWIVPTAVDAEGGDLLARRFGEVVEEARSRFDVIVVDSPPLLGTDDARTLVSSAEGVLLVVGAGAPAPAVNEAILVVESLGAPLLGIVGNRIKQAKELYYY
jgi:capsular exopolysaccharide synthesis family protein